MNFYKFWLFQIFLILRIIQQREVDLVINLPNKNTKFVKENYLIRRAAVDYGVPVISNLQVILIFLEIILNFFLISFLFS